MKKIYFILFIFTSCAAMHSKKSIDKHVLFIELNLGAYDDFNRFQFVPNSKTKSNVILHTEGKDIVKIVAESGNKREITEIYLYKSAPILIQEKTKKSSYKIYIQNWEKSKVEIVSMNGKTYSETIFLKEKSKYQALIEKAKENLIW